MTRFNNQKITKMKKIKLITAWILTTVMFIGTFPISIVIYSLAAEEYTWTDYYQNNPPPVYYKIWFDFVSYPFKLLKIE